MPGYGNVYFFTTFPGFHSSGCAPRHRRLGWSVLWTLRIRYLLLQLSHFGLDSFGLVPARIWTFSSSTSGSRSGRTCRWIFLCISSFNCNSCCSYHHSSLKISSEVQTYFTQTTVDPPRDTSYPAFAFFRWIIHYLCTQARFLGSTQPSRAMFRHFGVTSNFSNPGGPIPLTSTPLSACIERGDDDLGVCKARARNRSVVRCEGCWGRADGKEDG
ncbi:hypothetical protein GALMADRAFT_1125500 [Galerina marginata CBS 339.88]|uniref:Uncharacterized protein n=1 Tax=Galerina marginata (strain CBS 339.88) TaxID=685588 RepID=A0A067TG27_GALM3|nr:hypothetical protein GALMADRAFT_1125500 [Galerina marginata CBS 339.88]